MKVTQSPPGGEGVVTYWFSKVTGPKKIERDCMCAHVSTSRSNFCWILG